MLDLGIFREYDIRGIYNQNLTQEVVFNIGRGIGELIKHGGRRDIIIGYDARSHSPILYEWLRAGLLKNNIEVFFIGLIPTPVAYFATFNTIENISCPNSIMITGSHNPPEYNGFKITLFQKPFYGEAIKKLGQSLLNNLSPYTNVENHSSKQIHALKAYKDFLVSHFSHLANFPYKIALDYGNGVGAVGLEEVLRKLNIQHDSLFEKPDGNFPNHHPDPSEEKNLIDLKKHMQENNISIGLAFDGDADRIALLTPNHSYKGDELAILFAEQIPNPIVIGEVKCSQIMYDEINKMGKAIMYKTGHSNLKVKLKELNAHLAAEMSGHMFFNDRYFGYDDAIYAALRILELFLKNTPKEIESKIKNLPHLYSTPEEKINANEENKFLLIEKLHEKLKNPPKDFPKILDIITIDGVRIIFENGWALLRASNTTPVLVTRFEAKTKDEALVYKNKLLEILEKIKNEI